MTLSMTGVPVAAPVATFPAEAARLSTDYLNRYSEALMLIEMAPVEPSVVEDLLSWRPVSYPEHFRESALRCAPAALAAYRTLDPAAVEAFEEICHGMDRLIGTVTTLLASRPQATDPALVVEVASTSLRGMISRANDFINSNGRSAVALDQEDSLQRVVDRLMAI